MINHMAKIRKWEICQSVGGASVKNVAEALGLLEPTAALLCARGYDTPEKAAAFLHYEGEILHDPFLLKDMKRACEVIEAALDENVKMTIYGDYDVDGVTAVSSLYLYLKSIGADVGYYIPNRTGEGYGINKSALDQLAAAGTKLLITVDTGVTASEEVGYAKELGMDVIVTDHHECHGELPEALAVVNPRRPDCEYPFKDLAGAGVAFKLICALEYRRRKRTGEECRDYLKDICEEYIDLITLGTVADVMPLTDENRLIVSVGLRRIHNTARPGLKALIEEAAGGSQKARTKDQHKRITSSTIGYVIAPRINAAGRISCASKAVDLFLTDLDEEAHRIATELCEINRERQAEENHIIEQTSGKIEKEHDFEHDRVIVLDADNWHHGVIGIVASRITEHYNLPSILISFDGDIGKGSGRSIKGLNLVEALKSCDDLLIKYGGHELAAGLTIDRSNLPEFKRRINEYARRQLTDDSFVTSIDVDMELCVKDITLAQAKELELLEPFGIANPVPLFMMSALKVTEVSPIGAGRHTRFSFEKDGAAIQAVCFGSSPEELGICRGDETDIIFNLNINEYQGVSSPQLVIRDIRYSASQCRAMAKDQEIYEAFLGGADTVGMDNIPSRDDIARLYVRLKRELAGAAGIVSLNSLREALNSSLPENVKMYSRVKLLLMLDVLRETGLITVSDDPHTYNKDDDMKKIELCTVTSKVNLENSPVYKRLRSAAR